MLGTDATGSDTVFLKGFAGTLHGDERQELPCCPQSDAHTPKKGALVLVESVRGQEPLAVRVLFVAAAVLKLVQEYQAGRVAEYAQVLRPTDPDGHERGRHDETRKEQLR